MIWTAKTILEALIRTWLDQFTFANLTEFECPTFEDGKYNRRADLLTIMCNGGKCPWTATGALDKNLRGEVVGHVPGGYRVAFEIKILRSDLRADLRQKWKHSPISQVVNEFYFVAPEGLIKPDSRGWFGEELPFGAGLIEAYRDTRKRWLGMPRPRVAKPAHPTLHPETPLWFTNYLAHRTLYGRASGGTLALKQAGHFSSPQMREEK